MLSSNIRSRTPWWVDRSEVRCGVCAQRYAAEVGYRCAACDAPICPHCVVILRERRQAFCPICPTEHGAD